MSAILDTAHIEPKGVTCEKLVTIDVRSDNGKAIMAQWEAFVTDTSRDEKSEGGQSLKELERIERMEDLLLQLPQIEIPTFHYFSEGLYAREIHAPRDAVIIGHEHRHECMNVMRQGRVWTVTNGVLMEIMPPFMGRSGARTRKASIVIEDMIWTTIHPNPDNETDIDKLEERYLIKSPTFLKYTQS
jgi:hypothetical protein